MSKSLVADKSETIVGICFIVGIILPHTNTILQLCNIVMCLVLYFYFREKCDPKLKATKNVLIFTLLISLLTNLAVIDLGGKAVMSLFYLILLILTFPMIGNIKIKNKYLYIVLGIIVISQMMFVMSFSPGILAMEFLYPVREEDMRVYSYFVRDSGSISASFDLRNGGLFRNANQCSKYLCIILACYLLENKQAKISGFLGFLPVCLFSILMTGSRTGLVISSLLIIAWTYYNKHIKKAYKFFLYVLFIIAAIVLLSGKSGLRGANVAGGFEDSANTKFNILTFYLDSDISFLSLFFGNVDSSIFTNSQLTLFDSEYGYYIYCYGIVGFMVYLLFWYNMIRATPKFGRISYFILLWMISSTVLLAFRCGFVAMLMFSRFYSERHYKYKEVIK